MQQVSKGFIDIVIPSWNGKKMLQTCLNSLKLQTNSDFQVIVVDNGSTDGTVEFLEHDFPEIKLIKFNDNTGFSIAVNAGIEATQADWILLLNNDMEIAPDCLENLTKAVIKNTEYDFFALKMLGFNNRNIIDGAGDAVLRGGVGYRLGTLETDSKRYQINRETFGACGGAGLYSKEFFNKVGLFDPDFFAYLEDVDLNMRARKIGLRCLFLADSKVYHIGSATTGSKINALTIRLSTRNNLAVIVKNYPLWMIVRFMLSILIYQVLWALFCIKKKMFSPYLVGLFEAVKMLPKNLAQRKKLKAQDAQWVDNTKTFANQVKLAEKDAVISIMSRREAQGKSNFVFKIYCKLFL